MKLAVVLTQWKRNNLEQQLKHVSNQKDITIDYLIVFQNENHIDISNIKSKYNFIHINSDYNTKFFGRFAYLFTFPIDLCIVLDDDIMPAPLCFKNYISQCISKNAIIGGNGRFGQLSPYKKQLTQPSDVGLRKGLKVDFVGHLWCFKKEWLYYMFGTKPYTYDTGEDMHFCFSAKINGNIESYVGEQLHVLTISDLSYNKLASDQFASYITTKKELRIAIEQYWLDKGLKFIESN
tara:strand:- start:132 stop:839 length:708 start_codon:yes stop_codon:yes gene_type:complete